MESSMTGKKILVAEDSMEVRIALEDALSEEGYEVQATALGETALRAFAEFNPDLAVLDLRLPDMSGIDICSRIRQHSKIPVLIFSAVEEQSEQDAAFRSGADEYIIKRNGLIVLLNSVQTHMNRETPAA